jgi:cytochrome c peroxidase
MRSVISACSYIGALVILCSPLADEVLAQDAPTACVAGTRTLPCSSSDRAERSARRVARCSEDPRVQLGLISSNVCIGGELFFRETFEGNGRTCGSCHPATNNYTLDARFIETLRPDDPLFVAEYDSRLSELEVPLLLRKYGLIKVNPDGFDDLDHKYAVRSVSHMLGLATSMTAPPPPFLDGSETGDWEHASDGTLITSRDRLGWGGDGAPGNGELRDFADGAIRQHMPRTLARTPGVDFVLPDDRERDALADFSRSIGRLNEVELHGVRLSDTAAQRGLASFLTGPARECSVRCHVNGGANTFNTNPAGQIISGLVNMSFDVGTSHVRVPEADQMQVPFDGGHGSSPVDRDGDGVAEMFGNGAMNIVPLIEAADTTPMFHTHAAATIEEAIDFYATDDFARAFVSRIGWGDVRAPGTAMTLTQLDVAEVGRFLRVVNAALNLYMAEARLTAAARVLATFGETHRDVQLGLIELAAVELDDAVEVLSGVQDLNVASQEAVRNALALLNSPASTGESAAERSDRIHRALSDVTRATVALGSGLEMSIGEGTLMF